MKKVSLSLVERVVSQLGMPDGSPEQGTGTSAKQEPSSFEEKKPRKKLYRNMEEKTIAGVCSGLAIHLDLDTALVKIVMLVAFLAGSFGFWIYVILWIAVPKAITPAQKCEMYGLPVTAGNMARFTTK